MPSPSAPLQTSSTERQRIPKFYSAPAAPVGHVLFSRTPDDYLECECGRLVLDRPALADHHKEVDTGRALDWSSQDGAS